eukprot:m.207993 g.207993  ORF g.207993 m.207993 type:complete len:68 (-) comp15038_c1_seq1:670-873(-)
MGITHWTNATISLFETAFQAKSIATLSFVLTALLEVGARYIRVYTVNFPTNNLTGRKGGCQGWFTAL